MKTFNYFVRISAASLVTAWSVYQAQATMYTIENGGLQSGWNLTIDNTLVEGGNSLVGGIQLASGASSIIAVCADVSGVTHLGSSYDYQAASFSGQNGLNPNWGYGNAGTGAPANPTTSYAAIQNAAYVFGMNQSVLSGSDVTLKAALQLAVWEALYDTGNPNGYGFTGGRFEAANSSSSAAATALSWLNTDLAGTGVGHLDVAAHTLYTGTLLQVLLASGAPDYRVQELLGLVTPGGNPSGAPVPEPATVIAGMLLLLPFAASMLRLLRWNRPL